MEISLREGLVGYVVLACCCVWVIFSRVLTSGIGDTVPESPRAAWLTPALTPLLAKDDYVVLFDTQYFST